MREDWEENLRPLNDLKATPSDQLIINIILIRISNREWQFNKNGRFIEKKPEAKRYLSGKFSIHVKTDLWIKDNDSCMI